MHGLSHDYSINKRLNQLFYHLDLITSSQKQPTYTHHQMQPYLKQKKVTSLSLKGKKNFVATPFYFKFRTIVIDVCEN